MDVLKIEHIIVVGHYGCSGVAAAIQNQRVGLADNWLRHLQDVISKHETRLARVTGLPERIDLLCELNVIEQVSNVCQTTIVQDAWARGQSLTVHGWCYSLLDGRVNDLELGVASSDELQPAYEAALARIRKSKALA